MKTIYDVQQLLKKFGIFIYVGDRLADLELMEAEIKELYFSNLIQKDELQQSLMLLQREINVEKNKKRE